MSSGQNQIKLNLCQKVGKKGKRKMFRLHENFCARFSIFLKGRKGK